MIRLVWFLLFKTVLENTILLVFSKLLLLSEFSVFYVLYNTNNWESNVFSLPVSLHLNNWESNVFSLPVSLHLLLSATKLNFFVKNGEQAE